MTISHKNRRTLSFVATITASFAVMLSPSLAHATGWSVQQVDGCTAPLNRNLSPDLGSYAITYNSVPHVFYSDNSQSVLKHAWLSGGVWQYEVIEGLASGVQDAGPTDPARVAAVVSGTELHVLYGLRGNLHHLVLSGTTWTVRELIDGVSASQNAFGTTTSHVGYPTSAILNGSNIYVAYRNMDTSTMRVAVFNTTWNSWFFYTVDSTTRDGSVGFNSYTASALYGGYVRIYHHDDVNGDLRECWSPVSDQTSWSCATLDGNTTADGRVNASVATAISAVVWNSGVNVFYNDSTNGNLRLARLDSTGWTRSIFATGTLSPSSAQVNGANMEVYFQTSIGDVQRIVKTTTSITSLPVDNGGGLTGSTSATPVGRMVSAVMYNGQPNVFYGDDMTSGTNTGNIRRSWWTP